MTPIRPAKKDDLERIASIVHDAIRHMNSEGIAQWDEVYPGRSVLEADIAHHQLHVAEYNHQVAGFITLNEEASPEYNDVPWQYPGKALIVHRFTVDPARQGQGLGTALMDYAEEQARERGYDTLRLDAFTKNPPAVALYEKRGYRKAGTVLFRKGLFYCYEKDMRSNLV
jgi:ribosomal protein S18 acetylase RimI-like enzyme